MKKISYFDGIFLWNLLTLNRLNIYTGSLSEFSSKEIFHVANEYAIKELSFFQSLTTLKRSNMNYPRLEKLTELMKGFITDIEMGYKKTFGNLDVIKSGIKQTLYA